MVFIKVQRILAIVTHLSWIGETFAAGAMDALLIGRLVYHLISGNENVGTVFYFYMN